ncbi:MAG TPA: hypothetical protein VFN95_02010 [Flavitalea sp.]|nr:hypothetical protein [Flavitalea sp.]
MVSIVLWITILFLIYNAVLLIFPLKREVIYLNEERAEEFVYSRVSYTKVFTGSGLIGELRTEQAWRDSFNLFLPYSGSCAGVEIIVLSKKLPEVLFIETNYIFKGFDRNLTSQLFDRLLYHVRFIFPALLRKHSPKSILKELIKWTNRSTEKDQTKSLFQPSVEFFKGIYDELPDPGRFDKVLSSLREYIEAISSKGCQVVFFEMPIDVDLMNSKLATYQRDKLISLFPKKKYHWITPNPDDHYNTTDGIHLDKASVDKYFNYLRQEYNQVSKAHHSSMTAA